MAVKVKDTDKGWKRIQRAFAKLGPGMSVAVGIQGAVATAAHSGGVTNVELGAIHEFGAPKAGIPQRSFLRATADENVNRIAKRFEVIARGVADGGTATEGGLLQIGEEFRALVIDRIKAGIPPPLQQATIDRKGESTPLIDTGALIGSISVAMRKVG